MNHETWPPVSPNKGKDVGGDTDWTSGTKFDQSAAPPVRRGMNEPPAIRIDTYRSNADAEALRRQHDLLSIGQDRAKSFDVYQSQLEETVRRQAIEQRQQEEQRAREDSVGHLRAQISGYSEQASRQSVSPSRELSQAERMARLQRAPAPLDRWTRTKQLFKNLFS